ncbi:hypothetical protein TVAG_129540 [Trichomonas vaginalis G3]|uniref:Uncharacterized protein n=1 Tax=Trichomonas vaginalis (strain ATCC PRA-98 / G3) TaxID=412133 RepID=A2DI50_TRIV3|nr:hypothetical protein TVAG_129540 [Trichomonas vaginalis G3]|eukprot:XP_001580832.1 hypothetical protein [Trichomonas vaginalis G3]
MILFLVSYWEICKNAYDSSKFGRCLQKQYSAGTHFSNVSTTSIYLHTSSKSNLKVTNAEGEVVEMKPGEQISFVGSNVTANCIENVCPISFWNHNVDAVNQYFVNDAAGTVFSMENQTLEDTYSVYCDFGNYTKISLKYMNHSRVGNTGIFYYMIENKEFNYLSLQDDLESFYIMSPFMLQVRSSKYVSISFRIVAGSMIRPSTYFQKGISSGGVSVYNDMKLTKKNENPKFLKITKVSKVNNLWVQLELIFTVVGSLILLFTLNIIIILAVIHHQRKQEFVPEDDLGLTI